MTTENVLGGDPNPGASVFIAGQLTLNGGTLYASTDVTIDDSWRGITLGAGGGTVSVDPLKTLTVKNVITGAGGLTKGYVDASDTGTLTLEAANTYLGATAVTIVELRLSGPSGALSSSSAVRVAGGATLAGTGTAAGSVETSGTVAPGGAGSMGTLRSGAQTWLGGGSCRWPIAGVSGSISGSLANITVDKSGFTNSLGTGSMALGTSTLAGGGMTLDIVYSGGNPTAVTVASFGATLRKGRVVATWTTASLGTMLGFDLYRRSLKTGKWLKINRSLIPAQFGKPAGATYSVVDRAAPVGRRLTYRLKEICTGGLIRWHGPYRVTPKR